MKNSANWFSIQARAKTAQTSTPQANGVEIYIYDGIGGWDGFDAAELLNQIRGLDTDSITVHLSSPGGDAFEGLKIMNTLKKHKAEITIEIDGLAASAGSIIAMAGDRIVMSEGAIMMVHHPWCYCVGNSVSLRQKADFLDNLGSSIAQIYANRAGNTAEHWSEIMDGETSFTARQCVENGLADEAKGIDFGDDEPEEDDGKKASLPTTSNNGLIFDDVSSVLSATAEIIDAASQKNTVHNVSPHGDPQSIWESLTEKKEHDSNDNASINT